jgi:hypothetical protein
MKPPSGPCKRAKLPESVQHRLNMYALAASAAGVGMLALTPPAGAEIIYKSVHVPIGRSHRVFLDLNQDGKVDFEFHETFLTTSSVGEAHSLILSALPNHKGNQIWGVNHKASALAAGFLIGPKGRFSYGKKAMAVDQYQDGTGGSGTCGDPWNNVKNHYLGFKFTINSKTHFGWARLNVTCVTMFGNHVVSGLLTGYAYETIPGKAIIAGKTAGADEVGSGADEVNPAPVAVAAQEPSTLGLLAMGSPALSVWRRKERAGARSVND